MDNSLSIEATDWREGRRLRAFELKQEGWSQQQIAEALGVSKGAVSQWMKRAPQGGVQALKRQPAPGALPRLSEEQRAKVAELLERGAEAHGFRGDVWTCERVAIDDPQRVWGQLSSVSHVSRLLKALRQSLLQKPQRRANQRDEEAIERCKEQRWPSLKKGR
jgi:transposase